MTDETSPPAAGRWRRYFAAAALLAAAFIGFSVLTRAPSPKVGFTMTAAISEQRVRVGGAASLEDGTFAFDGHRISFTGTVEGDRVSIAGQIATADRTKTKFFEGGNNIVNGRATVTVKSSDGNRIGSLSLDFNPS